MPATAITTSQRRMSSSRASSRCSPATPTSLMRTTGAPSHSATSAASSATGRSLVPAQTTAIGAAAGRGPGSPSVTSRASSWTVTAGSNSRTRRRLRGIDASRERPTTTRRELAEGGGDLLGGLAGAVDQLGHAGAQLAVVIDHGGPDRVRDLGVRQRADLAGGLGGRDGAGTNLVEEAEQLRAVHGGFLPHFLRRVIRTASIARSVAATTSTSRGPKVRLSPWSGMRRNRSINRPAIVS